MLYSDLNLYIRAGSYKSVLEAAGDDHKQEKRCSVMVNKQEICTANVSRGFNIHVIDPYGKEITYEYQVFDLYHDKSKVLINKNFVFFFSFKMCFYTSIYTSFMLSFVYYLIIIS